MKSNM